MASQFKDFISGFKKIGTSTTVAVVLLLGASHFHTVAAPTQNEEANEVSVIKRAMPKYPQYAVKNGLEGAVLVSFSIEKDGNVSDIQVEASDKDGLFDASAKLAVQRWVFTKPSKKIRNNYVSLEFALTDNPDTTFFSNVEIIQIKGS